MAGAKEIRSKISSIQNTQKITRAMEMVAASKMRRAQERMLATRPYAERISDVIGHLAHANPEYQHPFLGDPGELHTAGYIVVTTDRGLCGGLNVNLFRRLVREFSEQRERGVELDTCAIGRKGVQFLQRTGVDISAQTMDLGDRPHLEDVIGPVKVMLDAYEEGRIQQLNLVYNRFVTTMNQRPEVLRLLPLEPSAEEEDSRRNRQWDYLYEPDPASILDTLLTRYLESLVYQGIVENVASEMAARMIAMKSASDNADNLIEDLQLAYNKARQAAITQELNEIVSGAAAV